jgi:transglutaminase-like putative cysteine protease
MVAEKFYTMGPHRAAPNLLSVRYRSIVEMFSTRRFQSIAILSMSFGSMLTAVMIAISNPAFANGERFPFHKCHLEYQFKNSVSGTLTDTLTVPSSVQVDTWTAYASYPPTCDSQNRVAAELRVADNATLRGSLAREKSQLGREVLFLHFHPTNGAYAHQITVLTRYSGNLFSQELVNGPSPIAVTPLTPSDREKALGSSKWLDWKSPSFQNWLDTQALRRKTNESDLQFSWRVFQKIRANYNYWYDEKQNRSVSNLVALNRTDCGGFCGLFVGALRANDIPARMLFGKWARYKNEGQTAIERSKNHVKAEFYADKIGWVPVELSGAICDKSAPAINYFGRSDGRFITLEIDPDVILDTRVIGDQCEDSLQNSAIWFHGRGPGWDRVTRRFDWVVDQP